MKTTIKSDDEHTQVRDSIHITAHRFRNTLVKLHLDKYTYRAFWDLTINNDDGGEFYTEICDE